MRRFLPLLLVAFVALLPGCGATNFPTHDVTVLRSIQKNPAAHSGSLFAFRGEVTDVRERNNSTRMNVAVGRYFGQHSADIGETMVVVFPGTTSIVSGDRVRVLGSPAAYGNLVDDAFGLVPFEAHAICSDQGCWATDSKRAEFDAWKAGTIFKPGTVIESKVAEAAGPPSR